MKRELFDFIQLYVNSNFEIKPFNKGDSNDLGNNINNFKEQLVNPISSNLKKVNKQYEKISNIFSTNISEKINSCKNEFKELFAKYDKMSKIDFTNCTDEEIVKIGEEFEKINKDFSELLNKFNNIIKESYEDFSKYIFNSLKEKKITEDELNGIINISNLNDEQKNAMKEAINKFKTEQQTIKDNEGENVNDNQPTSSQSGVQDEDVFEYIAGKDYFDSIKGSMEQERLSALQKMIDALKTKKRENNDKLSISDAIKLYNLTKEKETLKEMLRNRQSGLTSDKRGILVDSREKKLEDLNNNITELNQNLAEERRKLEQRRSKILKFISAKKVKKLEGKLGSLQQKFGKVKSAQIAAAIHAYDSQQRMVSFKTKLNIVSDNAKKVAGSVKDGAVAVAGATKKAVGAVKTGTGYVINGVKWTKRELDTLISELQNKPGTMTSPPVRTEELIENVNQNSDDLGHSLAA